MNLLERAKELNRRINQLSAYNSGEIIKKAVSDELTVEQIYSYSDLMPDWAMSNYKVDDICKYKGIIYRCRQAHDSTGNPHWTPDITPSLWVVIQLEPEADGILQWITGEEVKKGYMRMYNGVIYECIQGHTTQAGWTPPIVPSLWKAVG